MKKILVALVVLALAGGGAFAQGWTFTGQVDGGLMLGIFDAADDPVIGTSSTEGIGGVRTQLEARFTNADQTGGIFMRFRQDHGAGLGINAGHAWLSFMDNMLTVYGGLVEHSHFNTLDRMTSIDMGEGFGLSFIVRPMDNLTLGFGGFTTAGAGNWLLMGDADDDWADPLGYGIGQFKATFGAAFNEPDLFQVRFGFRTTHEAGARGWGQWGAPNMGRGTTSLAYLSFSYLALDDMHVAATAGFQNLEEFGDFGVMRFYVTAGHTGLVENLDARLGVGVSLPMWDAGDNDMHLWVWASAEYALSDQIVPRLDLHFVQGGDVMNSQGLHHENIRNASTWDSEDSFVQVRPSVQFRVSPAAFLQVGCIFNIDLGDGDTWGYGNGTNIGVFAVVRATF